MADIKRVRCEWSGSSLTGPGLSTFYFVSTATGFPADLQTFFQAVKGLLPTGVTITVPNSGDTIDVASGALSGAWTDAGGGTTTGTAFNSTAAGVGVSVKWATNAIASGRRVNGRTFLCPLTGAAFNPDGTPEASTLTTVGNAATALVTAVTPDLVVWHRPQVNPNGSTGVVISGTVRDTVSWLRSRRT